MVAHTLGTARSALMTGPALPLVVTILVRGLPGLWTPRHRLILWWLVVLQALFPGRTTVEELAHWTPAQVTAWRWRGVLQAADWEVPLRVAWWAQEALHPLPPPQDGPLVLGGDGSAPPQRSTQHPLAHHGRPRAHPPGCVGRRVALWSVHWEVSRLPGALRLLRPPKTPASHPAQALCRARVGRCLPPTWATRMIVEGAAASGSQDQSTLVMHRDADDPDRRWGVGCARARTWTTVEEKAMQDWGTPVPRPYAQRPRVPRLPGATGGQTFWV